MNAARLRAAARDVRGFVVAMVLVAGCASEAAVCVYFPCAVPEAGRIAVTATNAPIGVAGLTMTVSGAISGSGPCTEGDDGTSVCHVNGGIGTYHVQLSAPGYQSTTLAFTATGTAAGCNTCGHVDLQQRMVVLQPTS
jgi:hypothetical protein